MIDIESSSSEQGSTLGELLRMERERIGLSAERAAEILKLKKEFIVNLESDNYDSLPPDVYTRGALKHYAKLLDLDEEKTMEFYEEQRKLMELERPETSVSSAKKKDKGSPRFVITPEILFALVSFAVLVAIVLYFLSELGNFSKPPRLDVATPVENETVIEEKILIEGVTDGDAVLEINGQKINPGKEGNFSTEIVLMKGINEIILKADNKFGKSTEKKLVVNYNPAGDDEMVPATKAVRLKTESNPIWISVQSEFETFSETLAAETEKIVEVRGETKVIVEKGNGVYFTENGADLVIFAETEERAERVFFP